MAHRTHILLPWLLTGFSVAAMCALGLWQLERMGEKQQRLASIAQKQANGRLSLIEALAHTEPRDLNVYFQGVINAEQLLLLDNQINNQRVGYAVLVPVSTNAGQLLVNFGWIPSPDLTRTLPDISINPATDTFVGVITAPGINPLIKETNKNVSAFPALIQQIDYQALSQRLGYQLLPYVIQLTSDDPNFVREFQPVVMSPEKHLGYAVQWFGLAIAAAAIGVFAIKQKGRIDE